MTQASVQDPVHVAVRKDAATGAALRHATDALPAHAYLCLTYGRGSWTATAGNPVVGLPTVTRRGADIADVLERLAEALHVHDWRQHDDGRRCFHCGAEE